MLTLLALLAMTWNVADEMKEKRELFFPTRLSKFPLTCVEWYGDDFAQWQFRMESRMVWASSFTWNAVVEGWLCLAIKRKTRRQISDTGAGTKTHWVPQKQGVVKFLNSRQMCPLQLSSWSPMKAYVCAFELYYYSTNFTDERDKHLGKRLSKTLRVFYRS